MRRISRWFNDIFSPKQLQALDAMELVDAMNDPVIRKTWLWDVFEELKRMNLDVDRRLLAGESIAHLAARRKAYQDVLEGVLIAKRSVTLAHNHNQAAKKGEFDLDSVTVQPAPR